jgi:exopolysaccharide/PEP-CTERM locus tyrosine autokinase
MEKIKQALERARVARTTNSSPDKKILRSPRERIPVDVQKIVYTQTKSVNFSMEESREKRVIVGETSDSISDQYKVLRTQVIQRMKANKWNTIAITSPTEGCGKTLTSINLSISLAREVNHSVLLVDMDLRRPNIHTYFYSDEQPGIRDYLVNGKELSEILFNPGLDRLVILPGSKSIDNSSEMLSSPKMVQLVSELKSRYPNRLVIFDMPPLLSCDDMLAFSPYIDAVIVVVEEGSTRKNDLKRAYELLDKSNVLGVVLNKSKDSNTVGYY